MNLYSLEHILNCLLMVVLVRGACHNADGILEAATVSLLMGETVANVL